MLQFCSHRSEWDILNEIASGCRHPSLPLSPALPSNRTSSLGQNFAFRVGAHSGAVSSSICTCRAWHRELGMVAKLNAVSRRDVTPLSDRRHGPISALPSAFRLMGISAAGGCRAPLLSHFETVFWPDSITCRRIRAFAGGESVCCVTLPLPRRLCSLASGKCFMKSESPALSSPLLINL